MFIKHMQIKFESYYRGVWVAQRVKRPTLDFGSGNDLVVCKIEPHVGVCADVMEPAWDSGSPFLFVPLSLSFSLNKKKFESYYKCNL